MNENLSRVLAAILIGLGLCGAGLGIGRGVEHFRMADRSVTVKGLAEQTVKSDFAIWTLSFRRAANSFSEVQQSLSADRDQVMAFLNRSGVQAAEIEVRPLQVQDNYAREYAQANQPYRYTGTGLVIVKSARVDAVTKAAMSIDPLIQAGVGIEAGPGPRYQLRGFNDAKAPLLAEATRNAREQAAKFAREAGAKLGPLKNANQGVIRITGDDGSDMDDGSSQIKRLRVVSTFEYELR